jgi:two-component system, cell cycle sensor histidine kinase and response regulator CckA
LSDGRIINVNDGFLALSGLRRDECIGKTTLNVNVWKTPADRDAVVNELQKKGVCRNYEAVFQGKNGSELFGMMSAVLFKLEDIPYIISVIRDITERKRAETEQKKLEDKSRQLQKFESLARMAGAIAHHFNNQLQAVMMRLEMAMSAQPHDDGQSEILNEAMKSARKATEVSRLMLIYLGQSYEKHEPLDLSEAYLPRLSLLRTAMQQSLILEADIPSPGPNVNANANQMQTLLTNLVANAREAMGDRSGVIRLTVKTVCAADIPAMHRFPIDWQQQDTRYACLEVADAGCGIVESDFEKIFDPFFSTKFIGRGMGLAVVLGIVRAHGGVITVASEPSRSSVFRIYLPMSPEAVPQKPILEPGSA